MNPPEVSNTIPVHKSGPLKPLISKHLTTSTPDSHQISKRVKGLLAYSEHYKGNHIANERFSPLRAKDYRKARELTLEIWDPIVQAGFLEKFLKSQKNLQTLRIKVLTKEDHRREILKRLCRILSKIGGLSRVSIDFDKDQMIQAKPGLPKRVRSMRMLPKLKSLAVTVGGEPLLPFSLGLEKVGFDGENGSLAVKETPVIQKLINKAFKFQFLDTIRIDSMRTFAFPDKFLDALVLVISKLPDFRELNFNYSRDLYLPMKQTFNILDVIAKAPKFENFKLGLQMKGMYKISWLKHPLFKAKSMKRISLSFFFYRDASVKDLSQVFDLLGGMPRLYELSLDFANYTTMSDEIAENLMKKFGEITSLRKLKIRLTDSAVKLGAKQAGNMVRAIFSMNFLEELDLQLPKNCLELGGLNDIQGLPRLKKASVKMLRWDPERESEIRGLVGILGKCQKLKELELSLDNSVYDYEAMTRVLCESLKKLKELQAFEFDASAQWRGTNMTMDMMERLMAVFNRMRNLQDLAVFTGVNQAENGVRFDDVTDHGFLNKRKYRRLALGYAKSLML